MGSRDRTAHLLQTPDFPEQVSGDIVSARGLGLYCPNMPSDPRGSVCTLVSDACFTFETGPQVLFSLSPTRDVHVKNLGVGPVVFPCWDAPCFLRQGLLLP